VRRVTRWARSEVDRANNFSRAGRSMVYDVDVGVVDERAERLNGTVRRSASHRSRTARSSHASCEAMMGCCRVRGEVELPLFGGEKREMSNGR